MKAFWFFPLVVCVFLGFSIGYAEDAACLNQPKYINWEGSGSATAVLCGYQSGHANSSFIQIVNIPKKTKNGCVHIQYAPVNQTVENTDSLTIFPNEGVILNKVRSPTTLDIDEQQGAQSAELPLSTDSVNNNQYGFSVSGQSSSGDINVQINWSHDLSCGS